jgi:hypothetical protein
MGGRGSSSGGAAAGGSGAASSSKDVVVDEKQMTITQEQKPRVKTEIIQNEYAAGTRVYGTGFKYTVVEFKETPDGGIQADYANQSFPDGVKSGKLNKAETTVTDGYVTSGYSKHRTEFVGNAASQLDNAKYVTGQTFPIKDEIKQRGFRWNALHKRWER